MQIKVPAGYHKWAKRPEHGLSINILRRFLTKRQLEKLIDLYMETKREMVMEALSE